MKSIGKLINEFDGLDDQLKNVGKFNEMFPHCRLGRMTQTIDGVWEFIEFPSWWRVDILNPEAGNCRRIVLNGKEITHYMPISNRVEKTGKGRFKPIKVEGKNFESTMAACNHYKLSIDQFKAKFIEKIKGIYERR